MLSVRTPLSGFLPITRTEACVAPGVMMLVSVCSGAKQPAKPRFGIARSGWTGVSWLVPVKITKSRQWSALAVPPVTGTIASAVAKTAAVRFPGARRSGFRMMLPGTRGTAMGRRRICGLPA